MNRQHDEYRIYASEGALCLSNLSFQNATCCLERQQKPAPLTHPVAGTYTLYHFVDRWSCARCWRLAMALRQMEEWFANHDINVVLVGQSHYFQQAKNLAQELHLPFKLINDEHGSLKRLFGFGKSVHGSHHQTLVLVDKRGCVRYWRQIRSSGKGRELGNLQQLVEPLRAK